MKMAQQKRDKEDVIEGFVSDDNGGFVFIKTFWIHWIYDFSIEIFIFINSI